MDDVQKVTEFLRELFASEYKYIFLIIAITLINIPFLIIWGYRKKSKMNLRKANPFQLGKFQFQYRAKRLNIYTTNLIFFLIITGVSYSFYTDTQQTDETFALINLGVVLLSALFVALWFIISVIKFSSARIEIYENGFIINTGLSKNLLLYSDICRADWLDRNLSTFSGYPDLLKIFKTRVLVFYDRKGNPLAQVGTSTFRINERAVRKLSNINYEIEPESAAPMKNLITVVFGNFE
ncbi:MAG: hypothetical protein LBP51_02040 [Deferribacteraceae bacterium]|nr:hypothetical protein [Deferribacteraceae bacterium]